MSAELRSTARPSTLRLLGFLAVVGGAALMGIGATREWAAIGFAGDTAGANDISVHGTDLWEGKALLLAAAASLVLLLVLRVATSSGTRRVIATVLVVVGLAGAGIAGAAALGAKDRFAGTEAIDRMAAEISRQTGDSEAVVREALRRTLLGDLRVDTRVSVLLAVSGGVILALGGGLSLAWARERERSTASRVDAPPDGV